MKQDKKTITYCFHRTHSYFDKSANEQINFVSQPYQTGLYAIINSDPSKQFSIDYEDIYSIEQNLKKLQEQGEIENLKFGNFTMFDVDDYSDKVFPSNKEVENENI